LQIKKNDIRSINGKKAEVLEVLDTTLQLTPKCVILQDGKEYTVAIEDLKPYKGIKDGNS